MMNPLFTAINKQVNNSNPIVDLYKSGGNPFDFMYKISGNNPKMQQILQLLNNGSNPQQLFYQMCKNRGVNPETILNQFR